MLCYHSADEPFLRNILLPEEAGKVLNVHYRHLWARDILPAIRERKCESFSFSAFGLDSSGLFLWAPVCDT
jgi:hypothetical protein